MSFFAEIPEPEPELERGQRQLYVDVPWQAPQHWLPGNGALSIIVFRSEHTAVLLTIGEVYPRGLMFEVVALLSNSDDESFGWMSYSPMSSTSSPTFSLADRREIQDV